MRQVGLALVLLLAAQDICAGTPSPLLPAWLAPLELEITMQAADLAWAGAHLRELEVALRVADGVLRAELHTPDAAGGVLHGTLTHEPAAQTHLSVAARGVDGGAFAALSPYVSAMPSDLDLVLTARGRSRAALVATAEGHVVLDHAGGGIIEKTFERAGGSVVGNLLGKVLGAFRPLRDAEEMTVMECLRLAAPIAGGRLQTPAMIELWTPRMRVSGGGFIDLNDGRLDMVLVPAPRKGIRIGGLDAVHTIEVGGTLATPEVRVDSGQLLKRAAAFGTVVATAGGRAVIDTISTRRAAQGVPCAAIAAP